MNWFTDRHYFLLAVTFYGLSTLYSVFLWRKGFRRDDWVNYYLLAAGVALHTLAMTKRGLSLQSCPVNNLYEATTFLLWALGLASLAYALLPRFKFICAFAAPLLFTVGIFALMPSLDPPHGPKPEFSGAIRSLHAAGYDVVSSIELTLDLDRHPHDWQSDSLELHELQFRS